MREDTSCRHDFIRVYTKSRRQGTTLQLYCRKCGHVVRAPYKEARR